MGKRTQYDPATVQNAIKAIKGIGQNNNDCKNNELNFENMSLEEASVACGKTGLTYGQMQALQYAQYTRISR